MREGVPLGSFTTFGMGGSPRLLAEPRNYDEFIEAASKLRREKIPFRILGGGANVFIDDRGLDEAVILTTGCSLMIREGEDTRVLRLGAGVPINTFIARMREIGQTGAECLVGIPGSIGGATVMNAGGRHGWFNSIVRRVRILLPDGTDLEVDAADAGFDYRTSNFGDDRIVLETIVELEPGDKKAIQERGREILKEKSAAQPLTQKSAGCIFKNPPDGSAGKLLDAAGLKGLRRGGAEVSTKHANFIVNQGGATLDDVTGLIDEMRARVLEHAGISLEREVKVWSRR